MVIGILGVVVTVILGVWGILVVVRRKYPGEITFLKQDIIGLFDAIARNLPDLKILYKNDPISENLVLVKGYIVNSGRQDITKDMTEENLKITLPKNFRWIDKKLISSSPKVKADLSITDGTEIVFDIGLFRRGEYLQFEALAEILAEAAPAADKTSASNRLSENMHFTHRIANTDKVKEMSLGEYRELERIRTKSMVGVWGAAAFFFLLILFNTYYINRNAPVANIQYHYIPADGKPIIVRILPTEDGRFLMAKEVNGDRQFLVSPSEFFSLKDLHLTIVPRTINLLGIIKVKHKIIKDVMDASLILMFSTIVVLAAFMTYWVYRMTRRYRVISSNIEEVPKGE